MPIREFTDTTGTRWTVWSTVPYTSTGVVASLREGWLTFQSARGRKRLSPIPTAWESATPVQLEQWCATAEDSSRTPNTGTFRVAKPDG